jgi:hypothetical protein
MSIEIVPTGAALGAEAIAANVSSSILTGAGGSRVSAACGDRLDRGSQQTHRWREMDSNPRSPEGRVLPSTSPTPSGGRRGAARRLFMGMPNP